MKDTLDTLRGDVAKKHAAISELERMEMELIEQIKASQAEQHEAYNQLEQILTTKD